MAITKGAAYTLRVPFTTGLTITATVSKDAGAFAAATNACAEIGSTGVYSLELTATEMDAGVIDVGLAPNTGTAKLATISTDPVLNDFDPATDVVAHVTLVDTTTTNTDMRGTDDANTTAPDNAGIAAIKAKTDDLTFTTANKVDATVDTTALATASALADVAADVTSVLEDTGTTIPAAITALPTPLDAAGTTAAVEDATITATVSAADIRAAVGMASANFDTQIAGLPTDADVQVAAAAALAAYDPPTRAEATSDKAEVLAAIPTPPTAAAIADAVWDESMDGHDTTGTTGKALLDSAPAAGASPCTLTIRDSAGNPVGLGCEVRISTDIVGNDTVAFGYTNDASQVTFDLSDGVTYYCWRRMRNKSFSNPYAFVASVN